MELIVTQGEVMRLISFLRACKATGYIEDDLINIIENLVREHIETEQYLQITKDVNWRYQQTYFCPPDCGGEELDEFGYIPYCPTCDVKLNESPQQAFCIKCGQKLIYNEP